MNRDSQKQGGGGASVVFKKPYGPEVIEAERYYYLSPLAVVFLLLKTQLLVLFQRSILFSFRNHFHVALQGKLLREKPVVCCISSYPRDLCLC